MLSVAPVRWSKRRTISVAIGAALAALILLVAPPAEAQRRMAVIVGAEKAPARATAVTGAHDEARRIADHLLQLAGFARTTVRVLQDPEPKVVLRALDDFLKRARKNREETLIVFHYVGHADARAIYPKGKRLPLAALAAKLDDQRATVRLGILDTCCKEVQLTLRKPGSVLIAAHGSGAGGSGFTRHFAGGLRGAGDADADGLVTIGEAFNYARDLTTRGRADVGVRMTGDGALPLAALGSRKRALVLEQTSGPLEVRVRGGDEVVLTTPAGQRSFRLVLTAGDYDVRRASGQGNAVAVTVPPEGVVTVREADLDRGGTAPAAPSKPVAPPPAKPSPSAPAAAKPRARPPTPDDEPDEPDEPARAPRRPAVAAGPSPIVPTGRWHLELALGMRQARVFEPGLRVTDIEGRFAGAFRAVRGLSPRWHLGLPLAFAYAGGDARGWRWTPWLGVPSLAVGHTAQEGLVIGAVAGSGVDFWRALAPSFDVGVNAAALGLFRWALGPIGPCDRARGQACVTEVTWSSRPPAGTWSIEASGGMVFRPSARVALHIAGGVADTIYHAGGAFPGPGNRASDILLSVGSLQSRALRPQPLVRYLLAGGATLDLHTVVSFELATRRLVQTYMVGTTWLH